LLDKDKQGPIWFSPIYILFLIKNRNIDLGISCRSQALESNKCPKQLTSIRLIDLNHSIIISLHFHSYFPSNQTNRQHNFFFPIPQTMYSVKLFSGKTNWTHDRFSSAYNFFHIPFSIMPRP
jgi:hypothetical protein